MSILNVRPTFYTDSRRRVALALITFGIAALASPAAHAATMQSPIGGEIERMPVNNMAGPWPGRTESHRRESARTRSGRTLVAGGQTAMTPHHSLVDVPANRLTLVKLFTGAPPGCAAFGESGPAKSGACDNLTSGGFAAIAANGPGGSVTAGEVFGKWPLGSEPATSVLPEDFSDQLVWDALGYWYPVAILLFGPGISHAAAALSAVAFRARLTFSRIRNVRKRIFGPAIDRSDFLL